MGPHRDLPDRRFFRHDLATPPGFPKHARRSPANRCTTPTPKPISPRFSKILDPAKTEVRYNSEWALQTLRRSHRPPLLAISPRPHARTRGFPFTPRRRPSHPVHELLYPLLSAYDAVFPQIDVELGATEQKFNLLVHREIQREYGLPAGHSFTMPSSSAFDGQRKMSRASATTSHHRAPADSSAKSCPFPTTSMWTYYELTTRPHPAANRRASATKSPPAPSIPWTPRCACRRIVLGFHGPDPARKAAENFQRVFRDRESPTDVPVQKNSRRPAKKLIARPESNKNSHRPKAKPSASSNKVVSN